MKRGPEYNLIDKTKKKQRTAGKCQDDFMFHLKFEEKKTKQQQQLASTTPTVETRTATPTNKKHSSSESNASKQPGMLQQHQLGAPQLESSFSQNGNTTNSNNVINISVNNYINNSVVTKSPMSSRGQSTNNNLPSEELMEESFTIPDFLLTSPVPIRSSASPNINSTSTAIIVCMIDGTILNANNNFFKALGFREQEIMHIRIQFITHPQDLSSLNFFLLQLLVGSNSNDGQEIRLQRSDGTFVAIKFEATATRKSNGIGQTMKIKFQVPESNNAPGKPLPNNLKVLAKQRYNKDLLLKSMEYLAQVEDVRAALLWLCDEVYNVGYVTDNTRESATKLCFSPTHVPTVMVNDSRGCVIWVNSQCEQLAGSPRGALLGVNIMDMDFVKGTGLASLGKTVISEMPEILEMQSPATPVESLGIVITARSKGRRLDSKEFYDKQSCSQEKLVPSTDQVHAYVWETVIISVEPTVTANVPPTPTDEDSAKPNLTQFPPVFK